MCGNRILSASNCTPSTRHPFGCRWLYQCLPHPEAPKELELDSWRVELPNCQIAFMCTLLLLNVGSGFHCLHSFFFFFSLLLRLSIPDALPPAPLPILINRSQFQAKPATLMISTNFPFVFGRSGLVKHSLTAISARI